ncbi:Alpha/beta hydrolase fold-1 [Xylariaceae sp. FL0016]|nr:Alpha/beta hydrolase fold-1 [Xylariaceae sp. FL0016]
MSSPKPTLLLVNGAWHHPGLYSPLVKQLEAEGFHVLTPELRTLGADKHGKTHTDDVALIREIAIPRFDEGEEIIIVAHSYGGIPACASTEGLGVHERAAESKKGGFKAIVYLAAFAIPKRGMSLLEAFGGAWAPWMNPGATKAGNQLIGVNERAKYAFYNDVPDDGKVQRYFEELVPHSQDAMEAPVNYVAADLTIPKGYIICELDQALPRETQERLIVNVPGFEVERMHVGHSPFVNDPEECAKRIVKIIKIFK